MTTLVPLMAGVPFLAATALAVFGHWLGRRVADAFAVAASAATAAICLVVLVHVGQGLELHWFGGWHPRGHVAIGIDFAVDALGAGLAAFVALLMTLAMIYTWRGGSADTPHFQVIMLVFLGSMVAFSVTGDLFDLFVFFELMAVSAVALVGYRSDHREALQGALNFGVTNTLGSFLFLTGVALLYGRTGALNLAQRGEQLAHTGADGLVVVSLGLLCTGFFVKAAVVPFHFWLADAYTVAPASVCLLLAGALSEMGLFGFGRVFFTVYHEAFAGHEDVIRDVLMALGVLSALGGGMLALAQDNLKRMLAFVTVSYIGIFLCGLALLTADGVAGTAIYVVADGCGKAGLFALVGIVQHRTGLLGQRHLHGRVRHLRTVGALWFALGLLMATLPPFGAFLGKSVIDDALVKEGYEIVVALLAAAIALNAGAVLRAGAWIFLGWGERPPGGEEDDETDTETEQSSDRTPLTMLVPAVVLLAGAVAAGVWFGFADLVLAGAERFTDQTAYVERVLLGKDTLVLSPPSHAPLWFDWVIAGGGLAGSLLVAALGLWRDRARPVVAAAGAVVRPLHALHTGRIGDYTAWLVLGAGGVTALLALSL
jgi:multicomponent Na+:H+ antiporter subunit D